MADRLTKEQRRRTMQAVRSSGSEIERLLRAELWRLGLRYRKNMRAVIGCPDVVFKSEQVAVFCDSEFWHGFDWKRRKHDFHSNRKFWIGKIERNMRRDSEVTRELRGLGWRVVRFWGTEIMGDSKKCAKKVYQIVHSRRLSSKRSSHER